MFHCFVCWFGAVLFVERGSLFDINFSVFGRCSGVLMCASYRPELQRVMYAAKRPCRGITINLGTREDSGKVPPGDFLLHVCTLGFKDQYRCGTSLVISGALVTFVVLSVLCRPALRRVTWPVGLRSAYCFLVPAAVCACNPIWALRTFLRVQPNQWWLRLLSWSLSGGVSHEEISLFSLLGHASLKLCVKRHAN